MTAAPRDLDAQLADLRKAGRFREAAELAARHGDFARASALLAETWDHAGAVELARRAERFDLAYEHALAGELRNDVAPILDALRDKPEQAALAAAHAEKKGRHADAGRLYEGAGEVGRAAEAYERAGELFDAARCREAAGEYRQAGVLYERRLREVADDAEAALRLGRILVSFGRYDHAARALQIAAVEPERRDAAGTLLVACFHALGMADAAASRLDELRTRDPSLPVTVPELLEERFGDPRGLLGNAAKAATGEALLAGRYRVVRSLGAGATGRVLLAHDGFYDRDVAVKVLTVGGGAAGRDAYARFAKEARVAAGLEHPNVVRVFEFNPDGPFLVMELMAGGTLEERLVPGERSLSLPAIRHVMVSILGGLEAVHRRGVVHRDLKPANVFFGETGDVKIGDFGVAHLTDLGATLTGAMLGTLAYMAPEQITGASRPDPATDLYALGVILFRMLTGQLPFPGPDFVTQHLNQPAPAPSHASSVLGPAYDPLVLHLLAKEPAARPRTVAEVRAAISELPFVEPDENAFQIAAGPRAEAARSTRRSSAPPPPSGERYEMESPLEGGAMRARDALLDRVVRIEPCDEARAAMLRAFAAADTPFVQAVYDIDLEQRRAVLEEPSGRAWADAVLTPDERGRAIEGLRAAVRLLSGRGLVHGAIDADHVRVGPGRAVLLLPSHPAPDGADDEAALDALVR